MTQSARAFFAYAAAGILLGYAAMQPRRRDVVAHLLRIAACLLMLAAAAVVQHGRILGREMRVQLTELKPAQREVRDLEELRKFNLVEFIDKQNNNT